MKITGNEFANPVNVVLKVQNTPLGAVTDVKRHTGLTIRQELAARFMEAVIVRGDLALGHSIAERAFTLADAFIQENNRREDGKREVEE